MKPKEELPATERHTYDLGYTKTSIVFPVPPEPSLPIRIRDKLKKIGKGFWCMLTMICIVVAFIIPNHRNIREFYDTYHALFKLPDLPLIPKENNAKDGNVSR